MIDAFNSLINHEEDNWQEFLGKICLLDIFRELLNQYKDKPGMVKPLIRYIVWAYSKSSEMVTIGGDWLKSKKRIFDAAGLPPKEDTVDEVVYLKSDVILRTIQRWLNFQDEQTFSQLMMLRDLQIEMQVSANSPIRKSSGEVDFSQKFLNAGYIKSLRQDIRDLESELIQNDPKLKDAVKEIKMEGRKRNTIGVEKYAV